MSENEGLEIDPEQVSEDSIEEPTEYTAEAEDGIQDSQLKEFDRVTEEES